MLFFRVYCLLAGMINYCNTCKTIHTFPWYATIRSKNGGGE